jgi:hypothetical protein
VLVNKDTSVGVVCVQSNRTCSLLRTFTISYNALSVHIHVVVHRGEAGEGEDS